MLAYLLWVTVEHDAEYRTKQWVVMLNFYPGVVIWFGAGCGCIFAIIVKEATEDDIGESYVEN